MHIFQHPIVLHHWQEVQPHTGPEVGTYRLPRSYCSCRRPFEAIPLRTDTSQIATITTLLVGLSSPRIPLLPTIFALPIFVIFILNEVYYASDPFIPVKVLRSRGTLLTCLSTVGFFMARWSVLFYTPVYAIAVRGWAPASAGSMLVPTNAGFALGNLLTGFFHIRRAGSFYTYVPYSTASDGFPCCRSHDVRLTIVTVRHS